MHGMMKEKEIGRKKGINPRNITQSLRSYGCQGIVEAERGGIKTAFPILSLGHRRVEALSWKGQHGPRWEHASVPPRGSA